MHLIRWIRRACRTSLLFAMGCAPGNPASSSATLPPGELAQQTLLELFRNHHVEAQSDGEWLTFPGRPVRASATIAGEQKHGDVIKMVQLDIRLDLGSGRIIGESFAGVGDSTEAAIAEAFENFAANSLHVLLRGFFLESDDQVSVDEWEIGGKLRRVIIGRMGIRGRLPDPDQPPVDWFPTAVDKLKAMPLDAGTHWLRIYFAQMDHKVSNLEVLLDNDDWELLREQIASIEWPSGKEFFSVRVFVLITDI